MPIESNSQIARLGMNSGISMRVPGIVCNIIQNVKMPQALSELSCLVAYTNYDQV